MKSTRVWSDVYVQLHHCTIVLYTTSRPTKIQMLGPNSTHAHFAQQLRSHHRLIFFVCVYLHMSIDRAVCLSYEPASKCNAYRPVKSYGLLKYGIVALSRILQARSEARLRSCRSHPLFFSSLTLLKLDRILD